MRSTWNTAYLVYFIKTSKNFQLPTCETNKSSFQQQKLSGIKVVESESNILMKLIQFCNN